MNVPSALSRTFKSLETHRNYRLWFSGQVVSVTGTWVQNVAQAWFIAELTRSAFALGLLAACQFGPYTILGLFGGTLTDRRDNRHILMATQSALLVSAAMLAVLALTGIAQPWEVYVIAAFNGTVQVLDTPARQAFTIEMVGRDELANAVALNSSLFNASRLLGPAIGGVLIAALGVGICFAVNSLSFLAVLGALAAMRPADLVRPRRQSRHQTFLRATGEGLAYAWRATTTRTVMGMMLVVATLSLNFNVLLPVLTQQTLHSGPATFGVLSASFGGGALIGALVSATLGRASSRILLGGAAGLGLGQLALAPAGTVWLCSVVLLLTGIAFSLYASMTNATIQMETPDRLRGRVMAIYGYVFFGTAPFGGLFMGWLAGRNGTGFAFAVSGVCGLGATLAGLVLLKRQRRHPPRRALTVTGPDAVLTRE